MRYRYSTKQGVFETNDYQIPWDDLHSLYDEPAFEDLSSGYKIWCFADLFLKMRRQFLWLFLSGCLYL
jgi:hypothetical protein